MLKFVDVILVLMFFCNIFLKVGYNRVNISALSLLQSRCRNINNNSRRNFITL